MNLVDEPAAAAIPPSPAAIGVPGVFPTPLEESSGPARVTGGWVSIRRHLLNIALGFLAAEIAVLTRLAVGLPPDVLPFLLVVIAVCLVTVAAGLLGGITTMIVGGLLTWYQLLDPSGSWNVTGAGTHNWKRRRQQTL